MMKQYLQSKGLIENPKTWFCPKIIILFPEWRKKNGERVVVGVYDMIKDESHNEPKHSP